MLLGLYWADGTQNTSTAESPYVGRYMKNKSKLMQLDCTELGMVMTIVKASKDTDGKSLEMKWTLAPNSGGTPIQLENL